MRAAGALAAIHVQQELSVAGVVILHDCILPDAQ